FWPSPQSVWNWPPPAELDHGPYSGSLSGTSVTLVGATNAALGLSVTKKFTPDLIKLGITIEYTITNRGRATTSVAPWEITRVFPAGLTFYPTGGAPYPCGGMALPATSDFGGATWLEYDPASFSGIQKLFADGSGGYLAHATGQVLLVKAFQDTPADRSAPGEGEIEIFLDGQKRYIEVEQQGPYTALEPGQSLSWTVRWYLRKIPAGVALTAGSAELLSLAAAAAAP
ncbi:MAG TPA: DUF4380 domain-containing protein, partial [Polyangiaceae bacterium]|nr:DUF4380 domain-containing protein [Polyangiaceae bacterium]